jgi:hypothetical protein
MIPLLLMLAAADAPPKTPLDAERAFAADAQTIGQWSAFRKWATDDATMFVPRPVNAQAFLKDRTDPDKAIDWWPTASFVSCDGKTAVNTGGWQRPDGSVGYFTTVWQFRPDGTWRWIVDGGDDLKTPRPRPTAPITNRASCEGAPPKVGNPISLGMASGFGVSDDKTLGWGWVVQANGSRVFFAGIWDGVRITTAIADKIPAPPK